MSQFNALRSNLVTFESKLIRSEVTAVKFICDTIFAGIGGFLHVFDCKAQQLLYKQEIFEGQKIYGILPNRDQDKVLIHGGKKISLIYVEFSRATDEVTLNIGIVVSKTIKDWIMCAKFIENYTQIALVTMHNKISVWNNEFKMLNELECDEKCILYSAHICYEDFENLIVLSGTVFSEILIWKPSRTKEKSCAIIKRLKSHKGVIFSIDFCQAKGLICSTSDDRSAVLWKIKNENLCEQIQKNTLEISVAAKVYGHFSRIFRCKILDNFLATAGEDGQIIIWDFQGKMKKKIETHQPGPIWCLDFNESSNSIVSGGSDSGISTFSPSNKVSQEKLTIPEETAKFVCVLNSENIVCFTEQGTLYNYKRTLKTWNMIGEHRDLKNYALFQLSLCKNKFGLCGFDGQIYIYQDLKLLLKYQCSNATRIFSFHCLTCQTFLICQEDGLLSLLFVNGEEVITVDRFELPYSKERWSTCACVSNSGHLIVGNRKGDIFLYKKDSRTPIFTVKKAHCHLGVVNIYFKNNMVISLGRNGTFKKFKVTSDTLELVESNKVKYSWLAGIEGNFLLAFSGNKFIMSDFNHRRTLFNFDCGGGHRSWSFLNKNGKILFTFVKDKAVHLVETETKSIVPKDFVESFNSKEINDLKILRFKDANIFISGGEDTTLRISVLKNGTIFKNIQSSKVHLSSIRCIEVLENTTGRDFLVFSGGGRAQIICWNLSVTENDKGEIEACCREKYSLYEEIDQELPEIRVMDLTAFKIDAKITLFSGCSDGTIKVFILEIDKQSRYTLTLHRTLFYKYTCVLKIQIVRLLHRYILISMSTDGHIVFWNVSDIFDLSTDNNPINVFKVHDSGVNSFSYFILNETDLVLLTGGDDNSISLDLFSFETSGNIVRKQTFVDNSVHCAQITGVSILENYFFTSAIDQRITVFSWEILNESLICKFLGKYNSSIADLQGLQCFFKDKMYNIVVFGKGMEYIQVSIQ